MLSLTLPKSIPNGSSLAISWRGQIVASFAESNSLQVKASALALMAVAALIGCS